jgi:hypothetical protein
LLNFAQRALARVLPESLAVQGMSSLLAAIERVVLAVMPHGCAAC